MGRLRLMHSIMSRAAVILFSACLLFLVVEGVSRLEWSLRSNTSFFSPNVAFYYPELPRGEKAVAPNKEGSLEVLVLGGSVLHPDWGSIPQALLEKLTSASGKKVKVRNMAMPGHTTLDSFYKLRRLVDRRFDLIICYHGINELRLNNCPEQMYQQDYSHYSWYRVVNFFENRPNIPDLACLFSFGYRLVRLHEKIGSPPRYIPRDSPSEDMMRYGGYIKTAVSFRENMENILELAREGQSPLVLMTFAFHLPSDYSLEAFQARSLDYCLHSCAAEIWAKPEHLAEGLRVHNDIIRDLASRSNDVIFVDQYTQIPQCARHFNDVCHLTQEGSIRFVENLLKAAGPYVKNKRPENFTGMVQEKAAGSGS